MFNPFVPFNAQLLNAFVQAGKKYFVRQTFPRGKNLLEPGIKECFLYSHYSDHGSTQTHFGTLNTDLHRFLFEWEKEEHKIRLIKAANGIEGYKIFANLLYDDTDQRVSKRLEQSIMVYLKYKLNWYPTRNDGLQTQFFSHLGELYIDMKFRTKEVRVPLVEIENYKP